MASKNNSRQFQFWMAMSKFFQTLLLSLLVTAGAASANDYAYNKYDGLSFGKDGLPRDCSSEFYSESSLFAGAGPQLCELAKQVNQTATLTAITANFAVTLKRGAQCRLRLSSVGSNALQFVSQNYPITWGVVRNHIKNNRNWGYMPDSECANLRMLDSGGIFQ